MAKASSSLQLVSAFLATVFAITSLALVVEWVEGGKFSEGYLDGIDWDDRVFSWHPILMTVGLVFSFTAAILAYRVLPLMGASHKVCKVFHFGFHTTAIVCLAIGLRAVVKSHNATDQGDDHAANLYTAHAWMGVFTIVLYLQNWLAAMLLLVFPGAATEMRRKYIPLHIVLGVVTYLSAAGTLGAGISQMNAFLGVCSYTPNGEDTNPAKNYGKLKEGCRVSNWLAICVMITALFGLLAIADLQPREGSNETRSASDGPAPNATGTTSNAMASSAGAAEGGRRQELELDTVSRGSRDGRL